MSTYLVTGAAGLVASNVCELLLADGHTVLGVDNLNDYYDVRLKDYRISRLLKDQDWRSGRDFRKSIYLGSHPLASNVARTWQKNRAGENPHSAFIFKAVDIENLPAMDAIFSEYKFDAVFNLAARAGVRYSIENPHIYLSTNTLGTINLLECQRKYGVKKLVLASTSSLYGGCPMPFTEDQPVNTPLSPYAATKKAAELMAHTYHKLYGLDVSVLRYFTVFGPAGRPDMAPLRFIKWIDEGTPITLYGDGTQSRDFTYVDDIARGTILAARNLGYEIINLGGGRNPISLQTVIALIEEALAECGRKGGDGLPIKAHIVYRPFHIADLKETWADISKAKRLLDWEPRITPEEGFRRTVKWHIANRDWLKDIRL